MAREFSANDAKLLITKHQDLLKNLKSASRSEQVLRENINKAIEAYVEKEVFRVLSEVSVEELNREKRGIRVKPLIYHNLKTMVDVWGLSVENLSSIRGISEETAEVIKKTVDDFADKTRLEIRVKLSADNKTAEASELVKNISIYKNSINFIKQAKDVLNEYSNIIEQDIANLNFSTSGFKWLFSTKAKKIKATEAHNNLNELSSGEYGIKANEILSNISNISETNFDVAWNDFVNDNVNFYNILEELDPGLLGSENKVYGLPEDLAKEINDECLFPNGLTCTLRRYQEWGVKYILHQEKVLLGDEMGLGKTIQAIATMVSLKNIGSSHFLVVCPASVLTNWCREIEKHSLLKAIRVHGDDRDEAINLWLNSGGVAVTTFETVTHFNLPEEFKISLLVVDEAHYIKNPSAKRTSGTKKLCKHAERILFMTGTALENNVDEMIGLISILQPQVARSLKRIAFMSAAPQFREKVAPVYYRRKREEVLKELPDLIESKEWCEMSFDEEDVYEDAILARNFMQARRVSWNIDSLSKSSKAKRLMEIVKEAEEENRKVIVFSYFLDTISKISEFLGDRCLEPITGALLPNRRQEIIDEFNNSPAGSVLVSQIQSGGTGLNIQSASVVVICEPQLKPSIENQAISRAYRMGQSRSVLVYRLLCENSIDEKITDLLEQKQKIFDAFADESVSAKKSMEIDEKLLGDIISEEIERITQKRGLTSNKNENKEDKESV